MRKAHKDRSGKVHGNDDYKSYYYVDRFKRIVILLCGTYQSLDVEIRLFFVHNNTLDLKLVGLFQCLWWIFCQIQHNWNEKWMTFVSKNINRSENVNIFVSIEYFNVFYNITRETLDNFQTLNFNLFTRFYQSSIWSHTVPFWSRCFNFICKQLIGRIY